MKAAKLGNKDVMLSDRISHLPDDLIFRILSLVPISDAMNTSLLSRRWKLLWKMMPMLEYDEKSCPNIGSLGFGEFRRRSLQLHKAPVLQTLTLKLRQNSDALELPCFPNSVFQKLVVLKLHKIFLDFADSSPLRRNFSSKSPVCFQSLKSLHLTRVTFRGEEDFSRLMSACPILEDLFLVRVRTGFHFYGSSFFTISVPSLQRFEITNKTPKAPHYFGHVSEFKINAPSLKYLKIRDYAGHFNFSEVMMANLVEASLGVDLYETNKFLRFLNSAEFLSIHLCVTKVLLLADTISQRLLHLEICIYGKLSRNLLLHLLKHSPKLQVLKLGETHWDIKWPIYPNTACRTRIRSFENPPPSVCNPSSVPECLSFHLETFEWRFYEGREEEKEVILYILQNALRLKTAVIHVFSFCPPGGEKELRMIKELKSMPKASTSCQLVTRHK